MFQAVLSRLGSAPLQRSNPAAKATVASLTARRVSCALPCCVSLCEPVGGTTASESSENGGTVDLQKVFIVRFAGNVLLRAQSVELFRFHDRGSLPAPQPKADLGLSKYKFCSGWSDLRGGSSRNQTSFKLRSLSQRERESLWYHGNHCIHESDCNTRDRQ